MNLSPFLCTKCVGSSDVYCPMLAGTVIFNEVIKHEHMFLIISANRDINELGVK